MASAYIIVRTTKSRRQALLRQVQNPRPSIRTSVTPGSSGPSGKRGNGSKFVGGELAALTESRGRATALAAAPTAIVNVNTWAERFLDSRIDVDANTKKNYMSALRKVGETFGDRDPSTITATEIAEWIAALAKTRSRERSGQYLIAFRLLLDHVGIEPNAARDPG